MPERRILSMGQCGFDHGNISRTLLQRREVAAEIDPAGKMDRLYRLLYGRSPHADELALARSFLAESGNTPGAWERCAQALFLTNEFVFVD